MFKNFSKVFKFTFHNQVTTKSFKAATIIITALLIIVPVAIFALVGASSSDDDDELVACGAEKIYVVNEKNPDVDYSLLNSIGVKDYSSFDYINSKSVSEALETINNAGEVTSIVLEITEGEEGYSSRIVVPSKTVLDTEKVEKYDEFLSQNMNFFSVLASGQDVMALSMMSMPIETDSFKASSYKAGDSLFNDKAAVDQQNNDDMLKGFTPILTFISIMVIYFIVIMYGNGITQNVVMEKASKLMDTMLVSVHPQAMIFGKMLGVLAAAFIQFFSWVIGLVVGLIAGVKVIQMIKPGKDFAVVTFLKSFKELNIFTPVNTIIAVLVLILGIVFYCALAAICGAISSSREEAASNQAIFVIALLISFYLVLFGGMSGDVATWLYLLPFTSAMILPPQICAGTLDLGIGLAGLGIMVAATLLLIILAGKLYTMMALYKGKQVNIVTAFKMMKN